MPLVVCSPSNLAQFDTCPRKFYAMRSKQIVWKESPQKQRGMEVHSALEKAAKEGVGATPVWPSGVNQTYVLTVLQRLQRLVDAGATLCTEHEMCVNEKWEATDWWDNNALLRAKADLLVVVPGVSALLGDWKTGKVYPGSDMQLRTEALLVHVLYQVPVVNWSLFYVDQGETKSGKVDFSQGLGQVEDIIRLMKRVEYVVSQGGPFEARKNQFCRWCDWYHTPNCGESGGW